MAVPEPGADTGAMSGAKARQRAAARRRRRVVRAEHRRAAESVIGAHLRRLVREAPVIAGYAATGDEVDLDGPLATWLADGRVVALPRVVGPGELVLHRVGDLALDLVPGAHGIREPRADLPLVAPEDVLVVLVPGVVFDPGGRRIGYGGGFYDRLLPRLARALRVGVAFEVQVVERVITEPHDVSVDAVVTERGVYR